MKKYIALVLSVLLVLSLAACGQSENNTSETENTPSESDTLEASDMKIPDDFVLIQDGTELPGDVTEWLEKNNIQ